jgi:hypothetical protein
MDLLKLPSWYSRAIAGVVAMVELCNTARLITARNIVEDKKLFPACAELYRSKKKKDYDRKRQDETKSKLSRLGKLAKLKWPIALTLCTVAMYAKLGRAGYLDFLGDFSLFFGPVLIISLSRGSMASILLEWFTLASMDRIEDLNKLLKDSPKDQTETTEFWTMMTEGFISFNTAMCAVWRKGPPEGEETKAGAEEWTESHTLRQAKKGLPCLAWVDKPTRHIKRELSTVGVLLLIDLLMSTFIVCYFLFITAAALFHHESHHQAPGINTYAALFHAALALGAALRMVLRMIPLAKITTLCTATQGSYRTSILLGADYYGHLKDSAAIEEHDRFMQFLTTTRIGVEIPLIGYVKSDLLTGLMYSLVASAPVALGYVQKQMTSKSN